MEHGGEVAFAFEEADPGGADLAGSFVFVYAGVDAFADLADEDGIVVVGIDHDAGAGKFFLQFCRGQEEATGGIVFGRSKDNEIEVPFVVMVGRKDGEHIVCMVYLGMRLHGVDSFPEAGDDHGHFVDNEDGVEG